MGDFCLKGYAAAGKFIIQSDSRIPTNKTETIGGVKIDDPEIYIKTIMVAVIKTTLSAVRVPVT